jgi:hypothetical protein
MVPYQKIKTGKPAVARAEQEEIGDGRGPAGTREIRPMVLEKSTLLALTTVTNGRAIREQTLKICKPSSSLHNTHLDIKSK